MKVCRDCGSNFTADGWECTSCGQSPISRNGFLCFAPELDEKDGEFSAAFFEYLAQYEPLHFWFKARNRLILWALNRYFPNARSFFEIGCGTGFVLSGVQLACPEMELCGGDLFTRGLSFAHNRSGKAELIQVDARTIPFEEEFDLIGAFDLIEHIDEDEAVLASMHRAVKPGGGIMLAVPQHPGLWSAADEFAFHKRRYTKKELIEKVRRAGFTPIRTTSFMFILLPLLVFFRANQNRGKKPIDINKSLNVKPVLNFMFEKALGVERAFIRLGINFPAGGSLLMMARRD